MDDQWMIINNVDILSDWKNISTFFTKPLVGLYYRPLFSLSLMIDYHIGKTSPFIYHFTTIILHIISVILLYRVFILLNLTQKTSFLFSLIFAVHPVLLHAVAWIPGRNDVLLTIFALSSIIFLIKYAHQNKLLYFLLHVLFFICSLLTKENALMLPVFYITLLYHLKQPKKSYIIYIIVWLVTLFGWYALRSIAVKSSLTAGADVLDSIKNFIMGLLLYIGKATIPLNQSIFPTLQNSKIIFGIIAVITLIILVFKKGVSNKSLAIAGATLFFCMICVPLWYGATSSLGEHYEHRIYLPLVGLLLFISQINFNQNSPLFIYSTCLIILIFGLKSFSRMDIYKTQISFVDAGLKEAPDYYVFYAIKGDQFLIQQNYKASIPYYNKAIEMQPQRAQLYSSRAYAFIALNIKKQSIDDYDLAIKYASDNFDMYLNRCLAYKKFGDYENAYKDLDFLKQKSPQTIPQGLEEELTQLLDNYLSEKLNAQIIAEPQNATLYVRRAKLFISKNNLAAALEDVNRACELEPNNPLFKTYLNQIKVRIK